MAMLSPAQVGDLWGMSAGHVKRLCRRGELRAMKSGSAWRISEQAVAEYEQRHTTAAIEAWESTAKQQEVRAAATTIDGFSLPADYEPVFKDLWPGHEATTRKTASQRH